MWAGLLWLFRLLCGHCMSTLSVKDSKFIWRDDLSLPYYSMNYILRHVITWRQRRKSVSRTGDVQFLPFLHPTDPTLLPSSPPFSPTPPNHSPIPSVPPVKWGSGGITPWNCHLNLTNRLATDCNLAHFMCYFITYHYSFAHTYVKIWACPNRPGHLRAWIWVVRTPKDLRICLKAMHCKKKCKNWHELSMNAKISCNLVPAMNDRFTERDYSWLFNAILS